MDKCKIINYFIFIDGIERSKELMAFNKTSNND